MHLQSSAYLLGHEHLLVPMRSTQTYRCYRSIHVDSFFTVAASFLWSQFLQRRLIDKLAVVRSVPEQKDTKGQAISGFGAHSTKDPSRKSLKTGASILAHEQFAL